MPPKRNRDTGQAKGHDETATQGFVKVRVVEKIKRKASSPRDLSAAKKGADSRLWMMIRLSGT